MNRRCRFKGLQGVCRHGVSSFLGCKIKQGKGLKLDKEKLVFGINKNNIYAYPKDKSIKKFIEIIKKFLKARIMEEGKYLKSEQGTP